MTTKSDAKLERARPEARYVKPGEALAMAPSALHSGPKGFFWLFGGGSKGSERREDVAIVHVRDGLEHHDDSWGSDNYESILKRVTDAMSGADDLKSRKRARQELIWSTRYDEGYVEPEPCAPATPPSAVVLCLDSPGGVVSGLNETVKALQKLQRDSGIPLVAYVNEMAASAAYALACACDEIICPPSAILGSIGVISTIVVSPVWIRKLPFGSTAMSCSR
jgi:ClpP class serine protease